jgi:hypothetical protein
MGPNSELRSNVFDDVRTRITRHLQPQTRDSVLDEEIETFQVGLLTPMSLDVYLLDSVVRTGDPRYVQDE